jgi:hypothetical protein
MKEATLSNGIKVVFVFSYIFNSFCAIRLLEGIEPAKHFVVVFERFAEKLLSNRTYALIF